MHLSLMRSSRTRRAAILRGTLGTLAVLLAVGTAAAAWAYWQLRASLPVLEGHLSAPALAAPVTIERDVQGVPTITGESRADVAWALGFLHAQERYFQMDGQRRTASGELSELVGPVTIALDRRNRLHRFRSRAERALAAMPPEERRFLETYVSGVNGGLAALSGAPFEYLLLGARSEPWTAADTVLTVYAMYLTLQESHGETERWRANANEVLGQAFTDFFLPLGTTLDAPLDGSRLPTPAMPAAGTKRSVSPPGTRFVDVEATHPGSNGFAVGGGLTENGGAMVANDLHLALRVPNIWYRARLVVRNSPGAPDLDITGITLPGTPSVVAGSNGRVAWSFTNSYVDTSDVVTLEPHQGKSDWYRTPDGPRELAFYKERLCRKCPQPEDLTVEESVWGPVLGTDLQGRKLAYRWTAHDPTAVGLSAALELERAENARQALAIAQRLRIPHQNIVAGDADGSIGWTVTSALPRRFGHDGQKPSSWADGRAGWDGYLPSDEVPVVFNPERQRIWTANARVVGGESLAKLGFGGYAHGARAAQIRDGLFANDRFSESDLLAVQLDDRGTLLGRWQTILAEALSARPHQRELARLLPHVENWGERAIPESVGYRLVRAFRSDIIARLYDAYTREVPPIESGTATTRRTPRVRTNQADEPVWRLITEKPPHLVPPGYPDWAAVIDAALAALVVAIDTEAGGKVAAFTWGAFNKADIKHPLSRAVPGISVFLDAPRDAQPGDVYQPRVAAPEFGASARFVVSPGRERSGIFHMPTSQSAHPLSPYYRTGHADWAQARASAFLPGNTRWQLSLQP
jgi:penicillin amidase